MNNTDNFEVLKLNGINVIDNFLTEDECYSIIEESGRNPFWTTAKIALQQDTFSHHDCVSSHRESKVLHECSFGCSLKNKIDGITRLINRAIDFDLDKLENWQITRYEDGDFYNFHNDCGCWKYHPSGERRKTILIYLLPPREGGETFFRALNHYIMPMQGRLVFWDNLLKNGNCNHGMIHASLQVKMGTKVTLNNWIRQGNFINPT
jgi:Rps23 Pro-64 3,4-dihydroxylase Tpa1-like proline 4-hydroxylase